MHPSRFAHTLAIITACLLVESASTIAQDWDRRALIAALESLIATGEPRHAAHDEGERLQLAVDAAIARGDQEIERLAIRAAAPLTASISRPVSSTTGLPSIGVRSEDVLRVRRRIPYRAEVFASVDNGNFVRIQSVQSGKGEGGGRIDVMLPKSRAAAPGFHVVRFQANVTFGESQGAEGVAWTEMRTFAPTFYAIYDPLHESDAAIRGLVYGPAATTAREFDPLLGDEPLATWLSTVFAGRRAKSMSGPDWLSQYCDERIGEAGSRTVPTAICSVMYFQLGRDIGQVWFRTADIRESDGNVEWVPLVPPRFEGMVLHGSAQQSRLSVLPSLLATNPVSRPVGDVSIAPEDIILSPAVPRAGEFADATIKVRNIGDGDLYKVAVSVSFGVDSTARPTAREFVVDIPAQQSVDLKLQVAFPGGYGFIMAQALQLGEHAPAASWTPDPTPLNACAFRIFNPQVAPPKYLLADTSGCSGR